MSPKAIRGKRAKTPKAGTSMTAATPGVVHDRYCGGQRRQAEGTCTRPAGWGTDHVGQGKCKLHGGATPSQHGRYSTIQREPLRLLIAKHEADPDPLNMLSELAAARAFFEDFVNRYDEWREAILAWWQSWSLSRRSWSTDQVDAFRGIVDDFEEDTRSRGELTERQTEALGLAREFLDRLGSETEGRPRQILDVSAAHAMLGEITKIVERIERIRAANAISRPDLLRVMAEMGRVVEAHVKDETARTKIQEGWLAIRVA